MVTPVLMIVIPLLAAFLMPLIKKAHRYFTFSILLLNAILSVLLFAKVYNDGAIYETIAGFSPPVGIYLAVDNLSALLALIINLFATINFVTSKKDFKFSMLYLLAVTGATGIVLTGDIFNMFVFFEITAVASYALVASKKDEKAVEGSIKYMILGSVGSSFMLIGIAIIYSQLKSLNLYDIAARISSMDPKMMWLSFSFLLTGIGVEAELFPLNGWVPDAYEGASSNIASFLSFGPSKASIYAIARLLIIFSMSRTYELALYVGIATLLIGEVAAFMQKNEKRMLAYSSIGQMGLILIAFSLIKDTSYAIPAAFFMIVSHASAKSSLFLISGKKGFGGMTSKYVGLAGVLSLIGMPPMAGFWGKWYLLMGIADEKMWAVAAVIIFSAVIEAIYFARYLHKNLGEGESEDLGYSIPAAVMVSVSIIMGILPLVYNMAGGVLNA